MRKPFEFMCPGPWDVMSKTSFLFETGRDFLMLNPLMYKLGLLHLRHFHSTPITAQANQNVHFLLVFLHHNRNVHM